MTIIFLAAAVAFGQVRGSVETHNSSNATKGHPLGGNSGPGSIWNTPIWNSSPLGSLETPGLAEDFIEQQFFTDIPVKTTITTSMYSPYSSNRKFGVRPGDYYVLTSGRLENGIEVLTLFDGGSGMIHGMRFRISSPNDPKIAALRNELRTRPRRRIFLYGPMPRFVDLEKLASGKKPLDLIRRSRWRPRNLEKLNRTLNSISSITFTAENTKTINALPADEATAKQLGAWAGTPEGWVKAHDDIDQVLQEQIPSAVSEHEDFVRELTSGNSNLMVFVAHADRLRVFIGGKAIPFDELRKLPARKDEHAPRLAVLISCNAGSEGKKRDWLFRNKDVPGFAEILLSHNYVDMVIAPDKEITAEEAKETLQLFFANPQNTLLPAKWRRWAMQFLGIKERPS